MVQLLEPRRLLSAVTNTNDSGAGSFRQAILDSNTTGGVDTISFAIAGAGVHTISLLSQLPDLTDAVIIDGTTQGVSATPLIELDGTSAGAGANGLVITGGGSTVMGLAINRFTASGIRIQALGGNTIQGNFIGTNAAGTADLGNGLHGVYNVNTPGNLIGGTTAAARNVISGNDQHGVVIQGGISSSNIVQGNYIGTNAAGTAALGNTLGGILVQHSQANTIGGTTASERNIVSGNGANGVYLLGSGTSSTLLRGNYIGTDVNGTADLGNSLSGVQIDNGAASNTIGGTTAGARNIISGNNRFGITIQGTAATGNTVAGNLIGTNAAGTGAIGNTFSGITLYDAGSNTIGGTTASARNVISGNLQNGVYLSQAGAESNLVQGNFIGTDINGTADLGNTFNGVLFDAQASSNTIGGASAGTRNIISGNNQNGIRLVGPGGLSGGPASNLIQGNYIGTDVNAVADLGNTQNGVQVLQAKENTIGGAVAGAGNVISGNDQNGVQLWLGANAANLVQGNRIGTNAAGTATLANSLNGVQILSSSGNTIGGSVVAARNVISGNAESGVLIEGGKGQNMANVVRGNYIGTTATGNAALGNTQNGVKVLDSTGNTIGGTTPSARNVISGNNQNGINLVGDVGGPFAIPNSLVQGNYIGINAAGTADLGNMENGVLVEGISNLIGGTAAGAGNVISGNDRFGVEIIGHAFGNNTVQGNYIGTNPEGTGAIGNSLSGVTIYDGSSNLIGGTVAGAGNVISGNLQNGIFLSGSGTNRGGNLVEGNRIGTNAAGTADLGNLHNGVLISGTFRAVVGGNVAAAGNLISGNDQNGVYLLGVTTRESEISRNRIGTDVAGLPLGNTLSGVRISNAVSNNIGALSDTNGAGKANTIAYNGENGVTVTGGLSANNRILTNTMFLNTGLGIDLNDDGVTPNDIDDPDTGPNKLQNFPVISSAVLSGSNLTVTFTVPSISPNSTFPLRIEFYITDSAGQEGQKLLGVGGYTQGSTGVGTMAAQGAVVGSKIVLTATDNQGNTSEFSTAVTVT
ncbi:MAG: hypothetical protein AABP62_21840 [Planctomycetota bacterium]